MVEKVDIIGHFRKFDCHGNGLIIKGRVRSGKTYLLGILAKLFLQNGFAVISNVRFGNEAFIDYAGRLFYINSDVAFFEAYLKVPVGMPIILMWDDIQSNEGFKSTQVITSKGNALSSFLIFIGKLDCNYIYIAHQKYIPSCILDGFEPMIIYKFVRQSFIVSTDLHEKDTDVYKDISAISVPVPRKSDIEGLPILSKAVARFDFKLDLQALYDHLSRWDIGEDLRRGVAEFLGSDISSNEYDLLQELSYEKLYMAFCLKRDQLISGGSQFNEVMNPSTINQARKKLRKMGLT